MTFKLITFGNLKIVNTEPNSYSLRLTRLGVQYDTDEILQSFLMIYSILSTVKFILLMIKLKSLQ